MKGYEQITNPATGRKVSVYGKTGQNIIGSYINNGQKGGDVSAHMGARQRRRGHRLTEQVEDTSAIQLGTDSSVRIMSASPHNHDDDPANHPNVSSLSIKLVTPIARNLRPRARGTRAERDDGIRKGELLGPVFPTVLDSEKMADILQQNVTNKTRDQITFLAGHGAVSDAEQDAFDDAVKHGDGTGLIDFPNLKLLFRGVLYDFLMRDGKIVFQIEKSTDVHSKCQSRGSRRLDGTIHYTTSKQGKLNLNKVTLERGTCWPKKLSKEHPVAKVSL